MSVFDCRLLPFRLCSSLACVYMCVCIHAYSQEVLTNAPDVFSLPTLITFDEEVPQQLPTLLPAVELEGRASSDLPTILMLFWRRAKLPSSDYTHPAICSINLFHDAWVKAQRIAKAEPRNTFERRCSGTIRLLSLKTGGFRDGQCLCCGGKPLNHSVNSFFFFFFFLKKKHSLGPKFGR